MGKLLSASIANTTSANQSFHISYHFSLQEEALHWAEGGGLALVLQAPLDVVELDTNQIEIQLTNLGFIVTLPPCLPWFNFVHFDTFPVCFLVLKGT